MDTGNFTKISRFLAVCVLFCTGSAQSAIVHLPGNTVDFYYDDTQPGMIAYGTLMAVGDSIFATPTSFLAKSCDGGACTDGSSTTFSASGTVNVVAKPGYQFDFVAVQQQGDYQLNGAGASVSVTSDLTAEDSSDSIPNQTMTMINSGLGINDGSLRSWTSTGSFDLSTASWDGVTSIDLSLDTLLTASTSANGESALIQNKLTGGGLITIETVVVPVPAAIWLFISGILGLLARVGVKRKSY